MIVDWRAADRTRVLALLDPAADALFVEDVLFIAGEFGDDVVVSVLREANGALFVCLALANLIQSAVLDAAQAAQNVARGGPLVALLKLEHDQGVAEDEDGGEDDQDFDRGEDEEHDHDHHEATVLLAAPVRVTGEV